MGMRKIGRLPYMLTIVGAYAASPCHTAWQPGDEAQYLQGLAAIPEIQGLELPFYGGLHRWDDSWLLAQLSSPAVQNWNHVLTCLPGVMISASENSQFGLASESEAGRGAAIEFSEKARQAVLKIGKALGRPAVLAVEIHSAPPLGKPGVLSSREKFIESLNELRNWDWSGARLSVEHCDQYFPLADRPSGRGGQAPAKGFLSLDDEIHAVKASRGQTPVGIMVNWGRSAIEGRSAATPLQHIRKLRSAGLVDGVIFSGVTQGDELYGDWADSHAPFGSLMTVDAARECLEALGPGAGFAGIKIQALPKALSVAERIAFVRDSVATYARIRKGARV